MERSDKTVPFIRNLAQHHAPAALSPGKNQPPSPLNRRLGEPQNRLDVVGRANHARTGNWTPYFPARSLISMSTTLLRLPYTGCYLENTTYLTLPAKKTYIKVKLMSQWTPWTHMRQSRKKTVGVLTSAIDGVSTEDMCSPQSGTKNTDPPSFIPGPTFKRSSVVPMYVCNSVPTAKICTVTPSKTLTSDRSRHLAKDDSNGVMAITDINLVISPQEVVNIKADG
jgi:hypothetical protein